jgi:23S rRNA (cytidine1920-2'-O)/16S rRNA (cytidine1409-2'-O)-methyltransferase
LETWPISVEGRVVLDLGASTGGFTEVCLARGAARVFAVDVGHGQLHPRLAADKRVTNLEGVDARALTAVLIPERPSLIVCDASFISLTKLLGPGLVLAGERADLVVLVKPQFEVGREQIGKGGIVRDPQARANAVQTVATWLSGCGWPVQSDMESPIRGGEGAVEHLLWAKRHAPRGAD